MLLLISHVCMVTQKLDAKDAEIEAMARTHREKYSKAHPVSTASLTEATEKIASDVTGIHCSESRIAFHNTMLQNV